ncbi:MAG: C2H2-type zinc finger protein [Candidatus Nanohaloarchaea archaeon]|nr:C2H2-type zinc finger protein [Candidatus Nanohaloarchaea archaeon]
MPEYTCPHCNKDFESRDARKQHIKDAHDSHTASQSYKRVLSAFTDKKKLATLVFGITMIGLPLGGAIFYSTLGPSSTTSTTSGNGPTGYTQSPPVGYGIRSVPQPEQIPQRNILNAQLTKDQQVYLLMKGGPVEFRGGLRPAVLIQYSCTQCRGLIGDLVNFTRDFNQNQGWIYLAPNTRMNETIAVTAFQNSISLESFNATRIRQFTCTRTANQPLSCLGEDPFSG